MQKYSRSFIDQLKQRANFPRLLIQAGIDFTARSNDQLTCRCPFHEDHVPSMAIDIRRNIFYCHGCHVTGNIFTFIQRLFDKDFYAAVDYVQKNLLREGSIEDLKDPEKDLDATKFRSIMGSATLYFFEQLKKSVPANQYLQSRGIEESTIQRFGIGYANLAWTDLFDSMKDKYSKEDLYASGLIRKKNSRYFDSMIDRIIFPIYSKGGKPICFHGRRIDAQSEFKYVFTPATRFFDKRKNLFGFYQARKSIEEQREVFVVEGEFDCLAMVQAGFPTVSILGSDFSHWHATMLSEIADRIYFMFDNDDAGRNCLLKADQNSDGYFAEKFYIDYTGKDPFDYLANHKSKDILNGIRKM